MAPVHTRRLHAPSPPTAAHKLLLLYSTLSRIHISYGSTTTPFLALNTSGSSNGLISSSRIIKDWDAVSHNWLMDTYIVLSIRAHAHKVIQTASTRAPSDSIILSSWPGCSSNIVYLRPLVSLSESILSSSNHNIRGV